MYSLKGLALIAAATFGLSLWASTVPQESATARYVATQFKTHDGLTLSGHLAFPKSKAPPYPVVLLLVGSGTGNRYEEVSRYITADGKDALLFQPIEQELLAKGIAVMLYGKRGVSPTDLSFLNSNVDWNIFKTATADNLAADALAAFDSLSTHTEIDQSKMAVLGHSEGTILALKIAEQRPTQVRSLFMMGLLTRSMRDILVYQSIDNSQRYFSTLDADGDGYLTESEYNLAATADPVLGFILGGWAKLLPMDRSGDGRISMNEAHYVLELQAKGFFAQVDDLSKPWPTRTIPREWFQEYIAEGPYLARQLKFCSKIHLFQGEVDIQTPFEDALELSDKCGEQKTPLASFISYPELAHGFSPRIGYKKMRDTIGPIAPKLAQDIAGLAQTELAN